MGWAAELELLFENDGAVTRLRRRGGKGPLYVQKPFYPEGDICHVYLLHPPGGVVGGDTLSFRATATRGSGTLITTPAATKFMRSAGAIAAQSQSFSISTDAFVEWLPQETIVFTGARARNQTTVVLEKGAIFLGSEVVSLGRPANGERFDSGSYTGQLQINRYCEIQQRDRPIFMDRQHYRGGGSELSSGWGLGGHPVLGTLVATPADADNLQAIRRLPDSMSGKLQTTLVNDVLVIRTLGASTYRAQERLRGAWQVLRPQLLRRKAQSPAIWRT